VVLAAVALRVLLALVLQVLLLPLAILLWHLQIFRCNYLLPFEMLLPMHLCRQILRHARP
jgi:hypothetical protein